MPEQNLNCIQEAVCIHTKRIYDSCKDKDCVTELKIFPTVSSQAAIEGATALKGKSAELLCVNIDVEAAPYSKGCYTVSLRYYYLIKAVTYTCGTKGTEIEGLAIFDKRVILYGSQGGTKTFSSHDSTCAVRGGSGDVMPEAVVEALDPILLDIKLVENHHHHHRPCCPDPCCPDPPECDSDDLPAEVLAALDEPLFTGESCKDVFITLGQFSIVRLERDTQVLIPIYDFCLPQKDCVSADNISTEPCEIFRKIAFPTDAFFPPADGECALEATCPTT